MESLSDPSAQDPKKSPINANSKAYHAPSNNHGSTFYNYLKEPVDKEKRIKLESRSESLILVIKQLVSDLQNWNKEKQIITNYKELFAGSSSMNKLTTILK